MGWTPGKGLGNSLQGEKDNIKVALKDDLLGLGAKKEYGGGLWRGTAEVDDLYRRLEVGAGGKSEQQEDGVVKVEEVKKEEVKMRGGWKMRFLVGDTYTSSFSTEVSTAEVSEVEEPSSAVEESSGEVKESKKRKREEENGEKKKRSKKEKKDKKKKKGEEQVDNSVSEPVSRTDEERQKKEKTRSKLESTTTNQDEDEGAVADQVVPIKKDKKLKKEKKAKKEKKSKKEKTDEGDKKKKRKDKSKANDDVTESLSTSDSTSSASILETSVSVTDVDRSVPISRHMHRARFLAMKRASVMDPNALREILGVTG